LDWNLKRFTARYGLDDGYRRGDDISEFPIEKARFAGIYILIAISAVGTAAYGAVLNERTVSVPTPEIASSLTPSCSTSPSHL
jgi:hypothetical protein